MKKIFIILLIFLFPLLAWTLTLEEIENLSKNTATLNLSWEYFLEYLIENPSDERISEVGALISAKINLYNKYNLFKFANYIVSEDIKNFCINLGVLNTSFKIPQEDTEKILFIFPQIPHILEEIFSTGTFNEPSYKYLYKLEGLQNYIKVNSFEVFIKSIIEKSLSSPVFFDEDIEKFIETFIPKNNYGLFEQFILSSTYLVEEEKYLGAYKLLGFLKKHNAINQSLVTFTQLEEYFLIKQRLSSLTEGVFFVEKQQLPSFILEIYEVAFDLNKLSIEKNLLYNLFYPLLKTLNSKLENLQEKVPIYIEDINQDIDSLAFSFNEQINGELLKLQMNINRIENLAMKTEDKDDNKDIEATPVKKESNFYYIFVPIFVGVLFIFLFFEIFPTYSKINFLCNIKMGNYAIHLSEKLVMKNPDDYRNYLILAKSYEVKGKYEASINTYKTAMKIKEKKEGSE
jgi:hypothetical protein